MPPAIPPAPANASNFAEGHGGLQLGASNPWILVSRGGGLGLVVGFHGNRYRRQRTQRRQRFTSGADHSQLGECTAKGRVIAPHVPRPYPPKVASPQKMRLCGTLFYSSG